MRKYLLGTTALVAASAVATSAMAMPIQSKSESGVPILTVSMVAQFEGGIASNDNNASSGNTRDGGFVNGRFAEIYFDGVLTADNGLVYGAKIHYKTGNGDGTATTGYPGREYIYMKGGWGSLELGNWIAADSGMNLCVTCNTYAGFGALDTPWKSYVIRPTGTWEGGATGGGGSTNNLWFDQSPRVTYYMPVVGGLQAGVSYTPSVDQFTQTSNQADNNKQKDFISAGVQFNHEVDGVGIALSVVGGGSDGFLSNTTGTLGLNRIKDTTGIGYYELGARVKYAGFQFGGSWWDSGTGGAIKGRDYGWEAEGWSLEAAYFNGPYSMEVQYSQTAASSSRRVITATIATLHAATGATGLSAAPSAFTEDYDWAGWAFSFGYALAPGLKWYAEIVGADYDHTQSAADISANGTVNLDNSAIAILSGLVLGF